MNQMAFEVTIPQPFETAQERVIEALKQEGFGVLTRIDVHDTLKAKLGVDFREYAILGACNPPFANQAIAAERDIGLLLPCNVVVREDESGAVNVGFMDPKAVLEVVDNPVIEEIAVQVRERLVRVCESLNPDS